MGKSAERGTARRKLRVYLSTVDDYRRLEVAHPLARGIGMYGHGGDDAARWNVVLHALLLRKYFAQGDQLSLPKVVGAFRTAVSFDPNDAHVWASVMETLAVPTDFRLSNVDGPDGTLSDDDVHWALLYGRYLHGIPSRWEISERVTPEDSDAMMLMTVLERADRVKNVATYILGAVEGGHLLLEDPRPMA